MKKLLLTGMLLTAITAVQAHTHTPTPATSQPAASAAKPSPEATAPVPAAPVPQAGASNNDDTVIFLGTNEFYIALEREGVYRG